MCPNCNSIEYEEVVLVILSERVPINDSGHGERDGMWCRDCGILELKE